MNYKDRELVISALELVVQIDRLGFTEEDRDRAIDIIESLQEQVDELSFED